MTKANDSFKHCTGTDSYFNDLMLSGYYNDGVRQLADSCEPYWPNSTKNHFKTLEFKEDWLLHRNKAGIHIISGLSF